MQDNESMLAARTLSMPIDCPAATVYAFVSKRENLAKWAAGLDPSLQVRVAPKNDLGVADHYVTVAPGSEIHVPIRVLANGSGSLVLFTLFRQPEMSDDKFAEDERMVAADLERLKRLLEA